MSNEQKETRFHLCLLHTTVRWFIAARDLYIRIRAGNKSSLHDARLFVTFDLFNFSDRRCRSCIDYYAPLWLIKLPVLHINIKFIPGANPIRS